MRRLALPLAGAALALAACYREPVELLVAQIHFGQSDSACARLLVSGMGDNGKDTTQFSDAVKRDADDPLIAVARSTQTGRDVTFQAWGYASCADTLTKPIETSRVAAASFGLTQGRVFLELARADAGSGGGMGGGSGSSGGGASAGGGAAAAGGGSAGGGSAGGGLGGGTGGGLGGGSGADDGGLDDAGTLPDGGCPSCTDGTCRAGVCFLTFPFVTNTFDGMTGLRRSRVSDRVELGCGESRFDSTTLTFSGWCGQPQPTPIELPRSGKESVILLPMRGFGLDGGSLTFTGNRPVALVVFGDAVISGHLSASASFNVPGAGSPALDCSASASEGGSPTLASLGAGGGGFATAGGKGGGILNGATAGAVAGAAFTGGTALRAGCPGGHAFAVAATQAGAGGGAVQVSAAGALTVTGRVSAAGGGGRAAPQAATPPGGSGAGSGGMILLEGNVVTVAAGARVLALGGSGASGAISDSSNGSSDGSDGEDGRTDALSRANGGSAQDPAGAGGDGPLNLNDKGGDGKNGKTMGTAVGAGGGGAGGQGRIVIHAPLTTSCTVANNTVAPKDPALVCQ